MKAIRSLILYCIAGFAIFACFSYEDWLDQINSSLDGYASVENYREAQKLGASDREAYLAIKKAAAEKAQKEKEEKERLARIKAEKEKTRLEALNRDFPEGKDYAYYTDGSCKDSQTTTCIDQAKAQFACANLRKLGSNGMFPSQERLLAKNLATFRRGAEAQFISSANPQNGVIVWTENFAKTFEACFAQATLAGTMNGTSKTMNIQGKACVFSRDGDRFEVKFFCT